MCGIFGVATDHSMAQTLINGLKKLEYRGYDSAGLALINQDNGQLVRLRMQGKVSNLEQKVRESDHANGVVGIAHTRWATHGIPNERNAHPHLSRHQVALVHNGIIENHEQLRQELIALDYQFTSDTDSETIVHLVHYYHQRQPNDIAAALRLACQRLEGAFALAVISQTDPNHIAIARKGSPLVIGLGQNCHYVASDPLALFEHTEQFIFLEEGDVGVISAQDVIIRDHQGQEQTRPTVTMRSDATQVSKGTFSHYMHKEIYEQPEVVKATLDGRISETHVLEQAFGIKAVTIFEKVKAVQIVACGSSYYTARVARYWIESLTGLPCRVEIASEYRYRKVAVLPDTLFVTISQSGETADTLAAFHKSKQEAGYLSTLCICNVPTSTLVRESELALLTHAGPEICVASTKAFTTQLVDLLLLTLVLAKHRGLTEAQEIEHVQALRHLPVVLEDILTLDQQIAQMAKSFANKHNALFLGRGTQYPVALEGALKLKEISYIHAEGYPAGELKHGPLALVDENMPVVVVAPNNELLEKLKSNLQEVQARGGELFVFADQDAKVDNSIKCTIIHMPKLSDIIAPIAYTLPLQLLAYHVALLKGTDVDQPRNLAKSVTVE